MSSERSSGPPMGWATKALGDIVAKLEAGVSVNADDQPCAVGEKGILKTSAVSEGRFYPQHNKRVWSKEVPLLATPVVGNSIIVSRMNTPALVGASAYVEEDWPALYLPDRLWQLVFRVDVETNVRWLSYFLQTPGSRHYIGVHATGTSGSMKNLPMRSFLQMPLLLPPCSEQCQMAEILDTIDEAIRKTEEVIAKLQQMKQGLLHDLLTRGIDDNGELREPDRHPEQFKDSELGKIPRAWNTRSLGDLTVAPVCYGIVQAGPYWHSGTPVLMIRDLAGDFRNGLHRTSPEIEQRYIRSRVSHGDVLISVKGTIGRIAVVPVHYVGNISRDLARLRFGSSVLPAFAYSYFGSEIGERRLGLAVVGTTRAEISMHVLRRLCIPVPSLQEQKGIADRYESISTRFEREERQVQKLRQLKSGLMDDLLTGRVRVPTASEPTP